MSGIWLFANVVLPILIVAMGLGAVVLHGRTTDREDRNVPGE